MTVELYEQGTGLTKRTRVKVSAPFGPEEKAAIRRALRRCSELSDFQKYLNVTEASAKSVLAAAGLPDATRDILIRADGTWTYLLSESVEEDLAPMSPGPGEYIASGAHFVLQNHVLDSEKGHAARILVQVARVRAALEGNETEEATSSSRGLDALLQEQYFKRNFEKPALSGLKSQAAGGKGSRSRRDDHLAWEAYFDKLQAREPGYGSRKVHYGRVAKRFNTKDSAAAKAIQRLKKNRRPE
jgi:hypothetical protein